MTILYGRDANGNQVPLLVDGSGIVQTSGGGTSWPGTSSQLTSGSGTAVNVGSGLSLAAGTLTSPSFTTIYDLEWANKTVPTTTPAAIVDSAGRSGTWFQYTTGTGSSISTDSTGLKFATTGSPSSPITRIFLEMSSVGMSLYGSRFRYWSAISGWPSGFNWQHWVSDGKESSSTNTVRTYFAGARRDDLSVFEVNTVAGQQTSTSTTAFRNSTCVVIEHDGCGTFSLRLGTYAGSWPSLASLQLFFVRPFTVGDLKTNTGDTGQTIDSSGGYASFIFFGRTIANTSGYLVRSRIDLG